MLKKISLASVLMLFTAAVLTGCSSNNSSGVRMVSRATGDLHTQAFKTGVADVHDSGATDFVMTCQNTSHTAGVPSVTQVLHVRVLYQPGYAVRTSEHDFAQNAAMHLYVYPTEQSPGAGPQVAEYTGTGVVELDVSGPQVKVKIVQANLSPVMVTNRMADPLGACKLTGMLVARRDAAATVMMIGDLTATSAAARTGPQGIREAALPVKE